MSLKLRVGTTYLIVAEKTVFYIKAVDATGHCSATDLFSSHQVTHPSHGTRTNLYQRWKSRAAAANAYARTKDTRYANLLAVAQFPFAYSSFVVEETYGAWGASARNLRDSVCDPALHPLFEVDSNPWSNPDPKRTFTLAIARCVTHLPAERASDSI